MKTDDSPFRGRKRAYALVSLITTIVEEAALAGVLLFLLPRLGLTVSHWLTAVILVGWAGYSYFTYHLGKKAIGRASPVGTEALIGARCITNSPLTPEGYVRIDAELWQAYSMSGDIPEEIPVIVKDIKRMTLFVVILEGDSGGGGEADSRGRYTDVESGGRGL